MSLRKHLTSLDFRSNCYIKPSQQRNAPFENTEKSPILYQELQTVHDAINKTDFLLLMEYLNSQMTSVQITNFMEENVQPVCKNNGKLRTDFCKSDDFRVTNTRFKHKNKHTHMYAYIIPYVRQSLVMMQLWNSAQRHIYKKIYIFF